MELSELTSHVRKALDAGVDPNVIVRAVDDSIGDWGQENGWSQWCDRDWLIDTRCSICGSSVPGACEHSDDPAQVVLTGKAALAWKPEGMK